MIITFDPTLTSIEVLTSSKLINLIYINKNKTLNLTLKMYTYAIDSKVELEN